MAQVQWGQVAKRTWGASCQGPLAFADGARCPGKVACGDGARLAGWRPSKPWPTTQPAKTTPRAQPTASVLAPCAALESKRSRAGLDHLRVRLWSQDLVGRQLAIGDGDRCAARPSRARPPTCWRRPRAAGRHPSRRHRQSRGPVAARHPCKPQDAAVVSMYRV
jgi:hypothetical protein